MFIWSLNPPQDWVDDLASISPPSAQLSHAELWWEAGFPWAPVQRWMLYNLVPISGMRADMVVGHGSLAHFLDTEYPCTCPVEWAATAEGEVICRRCGGGRSQARTRIYRTFVDRGYWAQPFWVLQGESGGHRNAYTPAEAKVARLMGQSERPPIAGSLPYTGWDWRVKRRVLQLDLSTRKEAHLRSARGAARAEAERSARVAQEAYLSASFDRIMASTPVDLFDDLPKTDRPHAPDESEVSARYIETGVY